MTEITNTTAPDADAIILSRHDADRVEAGIAALSDTLRGLVGRDISIPDLLAEGALAMAAQTAGDLAEIIGLARDEAGLADAAAKAEVAPVMAKPVIGTDATAAIQGDVIATKHAIRGARDLLLDTLGSNGRPEDLPTVDAVAGILATVTGYVERIEGALERATVTTKPA